jgi:uncharacterized repeat protein (TIGR02543 family)
MTLFAQWTVLPNHTVTFNANGGAGTMTAQTTNIPTALTANTFAWAGHTFVGWNTASDGSGIDYNNGAVYDFTASITLFAQWTTLPTYTVTFDNNGGTGTMLDQTNYAPAALTLNTFTQTGYTFTGWNTIALGGGTAYADGATYPFSADVTLYAQWSLNSYNVTFNAQGGAPTPSVQSVAFGGLVVAPADPIKTGYTFNGWFDAASGGAQWDFATDTMPASAITLYAQWTVNNYSVSFDAQGGAPIPADQSVAFGGFVTEPAAPAKTGYTFNGWYTASTGGTLWNFVSGTMGAADMTLFAQWSVNSYNVTFDAQGGAPTPGVQSVAFGGLVTAPTAPAKTGYTFNGWYTASTGGTQWNFASNTMGAADMTLFAQWSLNNTPPVITEGASVNVNMSQNGSPTPFSLTLHATDADNDTLTWSISTQAGHGTAVASGTGPSMVIAYTPNLNFLGSDSFVVQVADGHGGFDTITVNVTITAVEPTPFTIFLPLIMR